MKKLLIIIILLLITGCGNNKEYEIINKYPHDTDTFTEGLFFYNGSLNESSGLYNYSYFYKDIEIETGLSSDKKYFDPSLFIEGCTLYKDKLYLLTYKEHKVLVLDYDSLEILGELDYPHEGWGLTTDGKYLIASDGTSNIYYLDEELNEIKIISVKYNNQEVTNINELEYIDGYIWANIWKTNKIVIINSSGNVIKELDLTDNIKDDFDLSSVDVMNGIAYNKENKHVYITGKYWPYIYELKIYKKIYK